jgi:hypothetical protein
MRDRTRRPWGRLAGVALLLAGAGCGSGNGDTLASTDAGKTDSSLGHDAGRGGDTGKDVDASDGARGVRDARADSNGARDAQLDANCTTSEECGDGGFCLEDGTCCGSSAAVCGAACCSSGETCLFAQCVTLGADCTSAADCPAGDYCETDRGNGAPPSPTLDGALPDGGLDGHGPDGGVCSSPGPNRGRCNALPTTAACEYHPPVGGALDAIPMWQWGPTAIAAPNYTDVWSTPNVGRLYDANCDGRIDANDPPDIVFIAGNDLAGFPAGTNCQTATVGGTSPSMCHTASLRVIDGKNGAEIWTLMAIPGSVGFAGVTPAIGDTNGDGVPEIFAVTGEGYVVMLSNDGSLLRKSNLPIPGNGSVAFGWGGGLALADMTGSGFPEVTFGSTVFTTTGGALTLAFTGTGGLGGGNVMEALSTLADLDGAADDDLELLSGNTAYTSAGTILWQRSDLPDGFNAVADFNGDGKPDVVVVGPLPGSTPAQAYVWILNGADGTTLLGPVHLATTVHPSDGGPPLVADLDGDGKPEIGVATADYYWALKPNFTTSTIDIMWQMPNHDYSSSVTASVAFDFEGAGHPSIIYGDECFYWVFDGATGAVRFAAPHTSYTGTESPVVADIDGDGHAELLMVSNGADPSSAGWACFDATGAPVTINGVTWTPSTLPNKSYRGLVAFRDRESSWVGTRTLWNEHTYHLTNVCDDEDDLCAPPNLYGSIPTTETPSWTLPSAGFRLSSGSNDIFGAPDAVVALRVECGSPTRVIATVRNIGQGSLPASVDVGIFRASDAGSVQVAAASTTVPLLYGQDEDLSVSIPAGMGAPSDTYTAQILPGIPAAFRECVTSNDVSGAATAHCVP